MLASLIKLKQILTREEKLQLVILLLVILLMAFMQALGVASVMPFIGLVMEPGLVFENEWLFKAYEVFKFTNVQSFIIAAGILMFILIVLSNAISALATWMKIRFAWRSNHHLSRRLLEKYLYMPYSFFLNQNSADLTKNVLGEVKHLTSSFLIPLLMLITRGVTVIFIFAMLLWADIILSLSAMVLLGGAYIVIYISIARKLKQRGSLRMKANKLRFKTVNEAFGGIKEVKVTHREPFFLKKYSRASMENVKHQSWNAVIGQIPAFALEAIAFGGIILFVLVLLITHEDVQQVVPMVTLFAFAGYRLMPAFQQIFISFTQMQFNKAVLNRVHRDITKGDKDGHSPDRLKEAHPEPLPFRKEIRIQGVTYSYPGTHSSVIEGMNMVIAHNTSIALVGSTGSGKTTLADIILGLLVPQEGALSIDGVTLDEQNIFRWQLNLGYVPQHIFLRDDTVARNIAFGRLDKEIDMEKLEAVARVANIHDFIITELPKGFDTVVGERGIRLSGGQRQRIGIARALYHDPEVIIFDEATSALDGVTEDAVLHAMENAARLKTLIVIAHRITTVKNCDIIYLIDKGKIVDRGTYEELLKSNRQFRSMAKIK